MSLVVQGGRGLLARATPYLFSAGQYMIEWLTKKIRQARSSQAMRQLGPVIVSEVTKTGEHLITTVGEEARQQITVLTSEGQAMVLRFPTGYLSELQTAVEEQERVAALLRKQLQLAQQMAADRKALSELL